jgi:hypothetical protein
MILFCFSCNEKEKELDTLHVPADRTSVFPYLTASGDQLLLSWIETVRDSIDVLKVAQGDANGFRNVTQVARGKDWFVNWADFPKIQQFTNGKYITHWLQKSSSSTYDYNIHIAIGDFGNQIPDTTFILHDDGVNAEHGFVSFLPFGKDMLAVWLDGRKTKNPDGSHGQMTLRSVVLDSKGNKKNDIEIDGKICDCCQTDLALVNGKPMVVYRDRTDKEVRDNYFAIYEHDEWTTGKPIFKDEWTIPGCPVNGPAIASIDGSTSAAWYTEGSGTPTVRMAFWNDEMREYDSPVLELNKDIIGRVDVKMVDEDTAVMLWLERESEKGVFYLSEIHTNGGQDEKRKVAEVDPGRTSGFAHMAVLKEQLFIAYTASAPNPGIRIKVLNFKK